MAKRPINRNVSGVRGNIPKNFVLGRASKGSGRVEILDAVRLRSIINSSHAEDTERARGIAQTIVDAAIAGLPDAAIYAPLTTGELSGGTDPVFVVTAAGEIIMAELV